MSPQLFLDENGHFCFCEVQERNGYFTATVRFERKADHVAMRERIPGVTHALKVQYPSRDEAMSAASAYALAVAGEETAFR